MVPAPPAFSTGPCKLSSRGQVCRSSHGRHGHPSRRASLRRPSPPTIRSGLSYPVCQQVKSEHNSGKPVGVRGRQGRWSRRPGFKSQAWPFPGCDLRFFGASVSPPAKRGQPPYLSQFCVCAFLRHTEKFYSSGMLTLVLTQTRHRERRRLEGRGGAGWHRAHSRRSVRTCHCFSDASVWDSKLTISHLLWRC